MSGGVSQYTKQLFYKHVKKPSVAVCISVRHILVATDTLQPSDGLQQHFPVLEDSPYDSRALPQHRDDDRPRLRKTIPNLQIQRR